MTRALSLLALTVAFLLVGVLWASAWADTNLTAAVFPPTPTSAGVVTGAVEAVDLSALPAFLPRDIPGDGELRIADDGELELTVDVPLYWLETCTNLQAGAWTRIELIDPATNLNAMAQVQAEYASTNRAGYFRAVRVPRPTPPPTRPTASAMPAAAPAMTNISTNVTFRGTGFRTAETSE